MAVITIEVISDIVCVWCYIGKRNLDRAIALYQKTYPGGSADTFDIKWRPYYLDYHTSPTSIDKREAFAQKMAGVPQDKVDAMVNRVTQAGQSVGITFNSGGRLGRTRDAHRLLDCAQKTATPEVRDALVEGLFAAYHERELDISDHSVLRRLAAEAGLDEAEAAAWLWSEEHGKEVDSEAEANRSVVTAGVPYFIIGGTHCVDGAQDPLEFMETFVKVREDAEAQA